MPAPEVDVDPHDSRNLVRSKYTSTFAHMGEVYVYHDLFGYILKMSPDILDFLDEFREPTEPAGICSKYGAAFGDMTPESMVGIFIEFGCLVVPGVDEVEQLWRAVPVKSRWTVWEKREDEGVTFWSAWGERPVTTLELSREEAQVWASFDSETRLDQLANWFDKDVIKRVVVKLAHHDVQAIKLSKVRLSFFKSRPHMIPPYLTSTMPYEAFDPDTDPTPEPFEATFSPEAYYEHQVEDADAQFDHQETTLSHLFRRPHPALQGRTFGQALVDGLADKDALPAGPKVRVLEVGAGLGWVAKAVYEALTARGLEVEYDILELSPTLAARQRETLEGLPVRVHEGNVMGDWPVEQVDFFLANEMIGDLPAVKLTAAQLGIDKQGELTEEEYDAVFEAGLAKTGKAGELVKKYTIPIGDAPEEFYLNVGAWELVEKIAERLAPGGVAMLTEFGEMGQYPILSTQLDHPELSIHFGHMTVVARELGLETELEFLMDLIAMEREMQGMRTTRSYFKALTAMLATHGIELEKIGYTKAMFEELIAGKIDPADFGELYFEDIENRLMGLVPHEFKAFIAKRPAE